MDLSAVPVIISEETDLFSMNIPRNQLLLCKSEVDKIHSLALKITINNEQTNLEAVNLAGKAKSIAKKIEDTRKNYLAPFNSHVKQVNGLAKEILAPLDSAELHLKKEIATYQAKLEIIRRQAEEQARLEVEQAQVKINAEAKLAGVEAPLIPEVLAPESKKANATRTENGTAYTVSTWNFEITNPQLIPLEYFTFDESKVKQAIKNGVREISGLKIFEQKETRIRS